MEVIVRGRHITVPARFRQHAAAKLAKLERLDQKAVRICLLYTSDAADE